MTTDELSQTLGVPIETIQQWVVEGLPFNPVDGKQDFDPVIVDEWLISSGRAVEEKEPVEEEYFTTHTEVGQHFGVSERTVAKWIARGMPGESGAYPRSQMDAWLEANHFGPYVDRNENGKDRGSAERRKAMADADIKELKASQLRRKLVEVDDMVREYRHHATHARALLEQLPDRLLGFLPANATGDDKRHFRDEAAKAVDSVVEVLHDWLIERANQLEAEQLSMESDDE